jgi:Bacterial regulatory protein, Fis family
LRVLPKRIAGYSASAALLSVPGNGNGFPPEGVDFEKEIAETERRYLRTALEKTGGVRTRAADLLKISYRSFRHYAKKHNLIETCGPEPESQQFLAIADRQKVSIEGDRVLIRNLLNTYVIDL